MNINFKREERKTINNWVYRMEALIYIKKVSHFLNTEQQKENNEDTTRELKKIRREKTRGGQNIYVIHI